MPVYVDNYYVLTGRNFGRMKMCHMIADTTDELLTMMDAIGVKRKWLQHPGTCNEHFDICLSMRKKAVALGAQEIGWRDYAKEIERRCDEIGVHFALASQTQRKKPG
jgi:hypothetical protein